MCSEALCGLQLCYLQHADQKNCVGLEHPVPNAYAQKACDHITVSVYRGNLRLAIVLPANGRPKQLCGLGSPILNAYTPNVCDYFTEMGTEIHCGFNCVTHFTTGFETWGRGKVLARKRPGEKLSGGEKSSQGSIRWKNVRPEKSPSGDTSGEEASGQGNIPAGKRPEGSVRGNASGGKFPRRKVWEWYVLVP